MKILVLNSGSSSIKYKLFDKNSLKEISSGVVEDIQSYSEFINKILTLININDIVAVGHRVVHGGDYFKEAVIIDDEVIDKIDKLSSLAPLHNPSNLAGIQAIKEIKEDLIQVAVFDTAFHQNIPDFASTYPLPFEYYQNLKIKKYGFHGTSHQFVTNRASEILKIDLNKLNIITLHLGNGASVCAIQNGVSIDTSMGFTPLEGLMMGTRCGDIDSSLIFYLKDKLHINDKEISNILNKKSGFVGICGENDLRKITKLSNDGDERATLAIEMFVYRIKKYVGSYMMILGRVDAIVFTGGIGENSDLIRDKICNSTNKFGIQSIVIPTNEELAIAKATIKLLDRE